MLKALADYIAANLSGLTKGGNLQVGFREQSAPDECTALQQRVGGLVDDDNSKYWQQPLQVLTRAKSHHSAHDECLRVFNFIRSIRQVSMSGFHVYTVSGISPQYLGSDEKGRHEFSANLILRIRKDD